MLVPLCPDRLYTSTPTPHRHTAVAFKTLCGLFKGVCSIAKIGRILTILGVGMVGGLNDGSRFSDFMPDRTEKVKSALGA
jgi:hypothetical protein